MAGLRIIKKAGKYHSAAGRCKHILQVYLIKTGWKSALPKEYGMCRVRAGSTGKVAELSLAKMEYAQVFKQHYREHFFSM